MNTLRRHLIRIRAIADKEIREVIRQPRLVVSLILGPFLILGLFAVGYQSRPPHFKTILVFPTGSELAHRTTQLEDALDPYVEVVDVTNDLAAAKQRLLGGDVDIVVVAPADAVDTIQSGSHAEIEILHTRLDPFDRANIAVFARTSIDELNRTLLAEVVRTAQEQVDQTDTALPAAQSAAAAYARALETGNRTEALQAQLELDRVLQAIENQVGLSGRLYQTLSLDTAGPYGELSSLRQEVSSIDTADPKAAEEAAAVADHLSTLETNLTQLETLPPDIAVQPFVAAEKSATGSDIPMTSYYAPAVMVVLLQHLAATFAALSVVAERTQGITDLFRIGPTTATDLLFGKYLGYCIIAATISTVLVVGLVFGFGVPMAGSWVWLAGIMGLLIVASLSLGFAISGMAGSESQAVQYSMLTLLFTIFFSGFILSLDRIISGLRWVSYLVPATAGIASLQDVMFRGRAPQPILLFALGGYALVAFLLSATVLRRRLASTSE